MGSSELSNASETEKNGYIVFNPDRSLASIIFKEMKYLNVGLLILLLFGCKSFDKDYYERITQIKFPNNYKVIASADNIEFMTITILTLINHLARILRRKTILSVLIKCIP